jgi:urease accessory protein
MYNGIDKTIKLVQLCDSAFPIGSFSFSNGLESAIEYGMIKDAQSLKEYTRSVILQNLHSDFIAALIAFRAAYSNNYNSINQADRLTYAGKISAEGRTMSTKMGKKCAELATILFPKSSLAIEWLQDIESGKVHGCHNISTAILFRAAGMDEGALFTALEYGTANVVLNAALRIFRISHKTIQSLLHEICALAPKDYEDIKELELYDMYSFAPECDILASLHEHGNRRLFSN